MVHTPTRKLAVILHADVVGSTALVHRNETLAHQRIQDTFRRFSTAIDLYGGVAHELRGDALVAEFDRASDAVAASLAFQTDNTKLNATIADDIQPHLRIGIAMGEVVVADNTVTGDGVVLAQRLEQLAESGGVCIQDATYQTIPRRLPFEYEDQGRQELKGFEDPVGVYAVALTPGVPIPSPEPRSAAEDARPAWRAMAGTIAAVLIVVGGWLAWWQPWVMRDEPASVERMAFPLPNKPSIAVLPFDNLSGDEEQDYFSDGMTNDIITGLSKFKGLFVIASNSTFTYKDKPVKVQQVAEDLGVRYVLEGSIQSTANRIRINAQLIDATSGHHLWAERYDRDAGDMFAVQNEIIETIVSTLAFRVETAERERALRKDTNSLDAYNYYLLATVNYYRFTKEANAKATELCRKAIELDPRYAKAISRLAFVHAKDYQYRWSKDPEASMELALELAHKAAALAPDDYFSHWTLGYLYLLQRDFDLSGAAYERARTLNPNDAEFLTSMSTTLIYLGRPQEAIDEIKKAMRLNAHYHETDLSYLGWAYYDAAQYEEAVRTFRSINSPATWVHRRLAAAYVRLGRLEEARAEIAQMLEKEPDYNLERTKVWPYKDVAQLDRYIQDLRKAGVPEHPS